MNKKVNQLDPVGTLLDTHLLMVADPDTGEMSKAEISELPGADLSAISQDIKMIKANPSIVLQAANSAETATLRLTESPDGNATFEGLYVKCISTGNRQVIGVHNTNGTNTADDIDALEFERATGNATFNKDLAVNGRQPGGLFNQYTPVTLTADGTATKNPVGAGVGLLRLLTGSLVAGAMFKIKNVFRLTSGSSDQDLTYKVRETSGSDMSLLTVGGSLFGIYPVLELETTILVKSVSSGTATLSIRTCVPGAAVDSGFADFTADATTFHNISIEVAFAGNGGGQTMESMLLHFERVF